MDAPKGPCDLHIHSHYSDGTMSPDEIVSYAAEVRELGAVSITDHDTMNGQAEAAAAGARCRIDVVSGIEFSVEEEGVSLHILGYCFDPRNAPLAAAIAELAAARVERAREIVRLLAEHGMPIPFDEVLREAGKGSLGRPHIARILHRRGHVPSVPEAFTRWIADGAPCNVPKKVLPLAEVTRLVAGAGGVAIWAHPGWNIKRPGLLDRLVGAGVAGIEAWHPNHAGRVTADILAAASDRGLVVTGGSDYHFAEIMQVDIGEIAVPYEALAALRDAAARGLHLA